MGSLAELAHLVAACSLAAGAGIEAGANLAALISAAGHNISLSELTRIKCLKLP